MAPRVRRARPARDVADRTGRVRFDPGPRRLLAHGHAAARLAAVLLTSHAGQAWWSVAGALRASPCLRASLPSRLRSLPASRAASLMLPSVRASSSAR